MYCKISFIRDLSTTRLGDVKPMVAKLLPMQKIQVRILKFGLMQVIGQSTRCDLVQLRLEVQTPWIDG